MYFQSIYHSQERGHDRSVFYYRFPFLLLVLLAAKAYSGDSVNQKPPEKITTLHQQLPSSPSPTKSRQKQLF